MDAYWNSVQADITRQGLAVRDSRVIKDGDNSPNLFTRLNVSFLIETTLRDPVLPAAYPDQYEFCNKTCSWTMRVPSYRPSPVEMQHPWVKRLGFEYEPDSSDFYGCGLEATDPSLAEVYRPHNMALLYRRLDFFIYLPRDCVQWPDDLHVLCMKPVLHPPPDESIR